VTLLLNQIGLIAWRSVIRTARQPAAVIPPLTFPLMLMAVNSNGFRGGGPPPPPPTPKFLDFFLPFSFIQGALFAATTAGTDLARDVDTGFLNRLALTPMRGAALLLGELGGAVALGALQAFVYLGVGLAFGVHFVTGIGGMATLLLLAILIALGWAAVGVLLALRAGTGEKVQSQFPLLFFLVFISSMNLPRNLIEVSWFRDLATINPVSYLIEGLRTLIIEGWNTQALALGFGVAILMVVGALGGASIALRGRMERT